MLRNPCSIRVSFEIDWRITLAIWRALDCDRLVFGASVIVLGFKLKRLEGACRRDGWRRCREVDLDYSRRSRRHNGEEHIAIAGSERKPSDDFLVPSEVDSLRLVGCVKENSTPNGVAS